MTQRLSVPPFPAVIPLVALASGVVACHDVSHFSSNPGDHYEGPAVAGDFVLNGQDPRSRLCLRLDASHLQSAPGTITTSDGRFKETALRPIPQIWHDPLSTLSFGEGRVENLVYVATPDADADALGDVFVVLSLMQTSGVEVRLLRSAPAIDGGPVAASLFAVFPLQRTEGLCSF